MTDYKLPMFDRLFPRTDWKGGRITHTDVLTLDDAPLEASRHAETQITPADFLRAAARGEITLRAVVRASAKVTKHDGGIYCNQGEPTENTVPSGAIPSLPIEACAQLANTGRASWRTFDGFEERGGILCRFTASQLVDGQPNFETTLADCRVTGDAVHALADAFIDCGDCSPTGSSIVSPETLGPCVTKQELIDGLQLNEPRWKDILQKPERDGKRYLPARVSKGRRGRGVGGSSNSALWNPIVFVRLAVENRDINQAKAVARFNKAWPQWQDELTAEIG